MWDNKNRCTLWITHLFCGKAARIPAFSGMQISRKWHLLRPTATSITHQLPTLFSFDHSHLLFSAVRHLFRADLTLLNSLVVKCVGFLSASDVALTAKSWINITCAHKVGCLCSNSLFQCLFWFPRWTIWALDGRYWPCFLEGRQPSWHSNKFGSPPFS